MQKYSIFIGIDMSKLWFDACIIQTGEEKKPPHGRFKNTNKGFARFRRWIKSYLKKNNLSAKCFICLEHMGLYTLPLCDYLQKVKIAYVLEHPLRIKLSSGIIRGKSDPADAAMIGRYLHTNQKKLKPSELPCFKLLKIKKLLSYRARLVKYKAGLKVAAGELKAYTPTQVHQEVCQSSDHTIKYMKEKIELTQQQIIQTIESDKELSRLYDLVFSVKGVGLVIAANMLVYTNAFTAFQNARQFACFIGLVPFGEQSGSSTDKKPKVSHMAHKKLKALITNGASSAVQYDAELKAFYLRKIKEGKNKYSALNAVKNKLVHRIFATVKRGTPFVELGTHKAQ